jgi:hypothetical protein
MLSREASSPEILEVGNRWRQEGLVHVHRLVRRVRAHPQPLRGTTENIRRELAEKTHLLREERLSLLRPRRQFFLVLLLLLVVDRLDLAVNARQRME